MKNIFKPRLDYGFSTTDRLYDYVSARAYGEHEVTKFINSCGHMNINLLYIQFKSCEFFIKYFQIMFQGNCHTVYYQCPFSAFRMMDDASDLMDAFNHSFP